MASGVMAISIPVWFLDDQAILPRRMGGAVGPVRPEPVWPCWPRRRAGRHGPVLARRRITPSPIGSIFPVAIHHIGNCGKFRSSIAALDRAHGGASACHVLAMSTDALMAVQPAKASPDRNRQQIHKLLKRGARQAKVNAA